jgi:hypothetical protein
MRKLVIALVACAGFALLAPTGAMAAPANGAVIDAAANETMTVTDVRYRHRCHHRCYHHKCWKPRRHKCCHRPHKPRRGY